jgi:uncharacterized membrane protein
METSTIVAVSNIFCGFITIVLSIPLVLKQVKMNHYYGIRIKKAFESDENWYRLNYYGGKLFMIAGTIMLILGIMGLIIPLSDKTIILMLALSPALIAILTTLPIFIYGKNLDNSEKKNC